MDDKAGLDGNLLILAGHKHRLWEL